ncbi:hypothetical protein WIX39_021335 [Variovorax sp. AB1(2024)]|uniref:hypothetical protein n=1 Tax=Variovorax sp. AB1(2024) TaxID=3132214 RepID=UPI003094D52F
MKNIKATLVAAVFLGAASLCAAQAETKTTLTKLHQSYEKQGRRALGMPEYGKRVQFAAVVIEASDSFGGTSLIRAADVRGSQELARLTPTDDAQSQRMGEMRSGAKFTASCEVGFAMGSAFLTMKDCVIQP